MKDIYTANAPEPIGPYVQAKHVENLLFCSGQIPIDPVSGEIDGATVGVQTHRVCKNIKALIESVGISFESVIKTTCYLTDPSHFEPFNKVYAEYFTNSPARSCVFVSALPKGALVEIEVTAWLLSGVCV